MFSILAKITQSLSDCWFKENILWSIIPGLKWMGVFKDVYVNKRLCFVNTYVYVIYIQMTSIIYSEYVKQVFYVIKMASG